MAVQKTNKMELRPLKVRNYSDMLKQLLPRATRRTTCTSSDNSRSKVCRVIPPDDANYSCHGHLKNVMQVQLKEALSGFNDSLIYIRIPIPSKDAANFLTCRGQLYKITKRRSVFTIQTRRDLDPVLGQGWD